MALFDNIQKVMYTTTLTVFGDEATWVESGDASITHTAKVLYNSPNNPVTVGHDKFEYRPYDYSIEYFTGTFDGLKASVDAGVIEYVTVCTLRLAVREVRATSDGKTLIAYCELAPNE